MFAARPGRRGAPARPRPSRSLDFARTLGFARRLDRARPAGLPFDAVIDASNAAALPALRRSSWSSPAGGSSTSALAGAPSLVDTRTLVLKDVTAVGVLSASRGLAGTIDLYASGAVDPRPLVAATVGLDEVAGCSPATARRMGTRAEDPRRSPTGVNTPT